MVLLFDLNQFSQLRAKKFIAICSKSLNSHNESEIEIREKANHFQLRISLNTVGKVKNMTFQLCNQECEKRRHGIAILKKKPNLRSQVKISNIHSICLLL